MMSRLFGKIKIKSCLSLILFLVLTVNIMISAMPYHTFAEETGEAEEKEYFASEDFEYYMNEDGTVTIYRYSGHDTDLQVPDTIDGYTVSSIDDYAFPTILRSITIPESVTDISGQAFHSCINLKNISVLSGNPIFVFQGNALYKKDTKELICVPAGLKLTEFSIPDGITGINGAFRWCDSLTNVEIPDSVTSIGGYAFYRCTSLTDIIIPNSVTSIDDYAFCECDSLTGIAVPDSAASIGDFAFFGCDSLTSITIPDSVAGIGVGAFSYCNNLININISSENPFFVFWENALYKKDTNELICVPDGLKLTEFSIPDGITGINGAFYGCDSLANVEIPKSVVSIGDYAFYLCGSLTSITIPDSVTSIGDYAFSDCYSLTSIAIPDSVTSIGEYSFAWCDSLTGITIPDSITSISDHAFSGLYSLTNIEIPDSVDSIGDYAFAGCFCLESVEIPDSVASIGDFAFYWCDSLTSITIPRSVTSIGKHAFTDCEKLIAMVGAGSYAEQYCKENGIEYVYPEDWSRLKD